MNRQGYVTIGALFLICSLGIMLTISTPEQIASLVLLGAGVYMVSVGMMQQ